ncbi:histidine phosphatase family protein [Alkalibacillus aidingensis]|uniref:histidine phosphatase family protein n=1 Tax=Alkalibacillus aidingensis TaxID=2747607 RepID=UPI00166138C0|nr:histidine phosphatase family protein [Alkalibacillus aidingensis]
MTKNIFIIRHCKADGQAPEAKLTTHGEKQAEELVDFFSDQPIDRIISSPYIRAIGSIKPLSNKLNLPINVDPRLAERVLSTSDLPNWMEQLEATFDNIDLKLEGGESNREALTRGREVIHEILNGDDENTIIVSHGGLISILLSHYMNGFGFTGWRGLSNPDVYLLTNQHGEIIVKRIWEKG